MNIWVLNHYAITPDMSGGTRHYDFGKELVKREHNVTIFTSSFHYNKYKEMKLAENEKWKVEKVDGVNFVWLKTFPYQKNDWRRVLNMFSFMWGVYWLGRKIRKQRKDIEKPDVIIGSTVHLLTVLSAYWLSKYYKAKFIMEIRDLWPQSLIDIGVIREKSLIAKALRCLEKFLYKRAKEIIIFSLPAKDYLSLFKIEQSKIHFIPQGVDVSRYALSLYNENRGKGFRIIYTGALGVINALEPVLKAAKIIQEKGLLDIKFIFVGAGVEKASLIEQAKILVLDNIEFRPPVPKKEIPAILNQADVLLLSENKIFYGGSNKLMDYMASSKPIIFSAPAIHNNVKKANCGISVLPGDPKSISDAVIKFYQMPSQERNEIGRRGREYVEKFHNIPVLVDKLEVLIQK